MSILYNFNTAFLQDLEKVMTNWNDNSEIGGVFLEGGLVRILTQPSHCANHTIGWIYEAVYFLCKQLF